MLVAATTGGNTVQFNFGWIILIVFWFAVYMVPTIVAVIRKVPNMGSVVVINLLLGWTLVGWVVALAMAVRSGNGTVVNVINGSVPICKKCGTPLVAGQQFCSSCGAPRTE